MIGYLAKRGVFRSAVVLGALLAASGVVHAQGACPARQSAPLVPKDRAMCALLNDAVRAPGALPLAEYEARLGDYLRNFCHRDTESGWVRDKRLRDTGPFTSTLVDGEWIGTDHGVHAPVVIWYSPEAIVWIRENRSAEDEGPGPDSSPVPDGAMIIKEMYPAPAARCDAVNPLELLPTSGAAVMVRDSTASFDGWFWGWFGWSGWKPDYPADQASNGYPLMGFGQYCVNCHASARDNLTFSSTRNIQGEPGEPLAYLSQNEALFAQLPAHHVALAKPPPPQPKGDMPLTDWLEGFRDAFPWRDLAPTRETVVSMPSETYDNFWMPANAPEDHAPFLTSDQCLGCHDAGSTGLHFDMTVPDPHSDKLINMSPYATWRTSPMGLAGRDPIFFAQLASETQTFHPEDPAMVETTCLGCHGVLGQRQAQLDNHAETGECGIFGRQDVNAVPWPANNPHFDKAGYGALARDGISCMACHQMALGTAATQEYGQSERNACAVERQKALNPGMTGFASTFTGSFLVNDGDKIIGPVEAPKTLPMQAALGITPHVDISITSSEVCGSCHTVHLPVLHRGETVAHIYEQTTYAEWAFSAHRSGKTLYGGELPGGAGTQAGECNDCHMPSGNPAKSKIASIQEHTGFPAADFTAAPDQIDLVERDNYSPHVFVGLNMFLVRMARQFPDILGLRTQDPMLVSKGVPPVVQTENQIYDNAANFTATIAVDDVKIDGTQLRASVAIANKVGHKFPSGVGFRRTFVTFEVLDAEGQVLWASGRTDGVGRLIDQTGEPVAGEVWWGPSCKVPADRASRAHQPHFQTVTAQDQVQIYQELVSTPPDQNAVSCGHDAKPEGELTTSFLSICAEVKDNRLLPEGYLPLEKRKEIARALGAGDDLAEDAGSTAVGDDPDYRTGGGDSLEYVVARDEMDGTPVSVRARLYYQATPPFYLQDRFCTATGPDAARLYYLAGHLDLLDTPAEGWKLLISDSGKVPLRQ